MNRVPQPVSKLGYLDRLLAVREARVNFREDRAEAIAVVTGRIHTYALSSGVIVR